MANIKTVVPERAKGIRSFFFRWVRGQYGGVVPEIASRAHIERLDAVIEEALEVAGCQLSDIDALAVTIFSSIIFLSNVCASSRSVVACSPYFASVSMSG